LAAATSASTLAPGDDDLARGVEIGGLDVEFPAQPGHARAILADDRRHAADRRLAGQLHQPAPFRHDLQAGGKIKHAGGRQRGDFSQAEAQGKFHFRQPAPFLQRRHDGQTVHEQRRLADLGLGQLRLRAGEADLAQIPAQQMVGLGVKRPGRGRALAKGEAHAHLLRALPGENQSE
jgi:hypothetical protein